MPVSKLSIKIHLEEMLIESLIKQEHINKLQDAADKCKSVSDVIIFKMKSLNLYLIAII